MHLLKCEIAVGGDLRNTVVRGKDNPVTYPEFHVLQSIHGESFITGASVVGEVERDAVEEKERLLLKYPPKAVEALFPGRRPIMELEVPGVKAPRPEDATEPDDVGELADPFAVAG